MNSFEKSVIIPMNPHGSYSGGSTPGSIIAQKWFADLKGDVTISFDKGCRYVNSPEKPNLGFFYDTSRGKVTHRFSIVDVTDDDGIGKYVEEFLPPWRQELRETKLKDEEQRTWLVITDIFELKEPKELAYFDKKRCQSFVYSSKGSELTYCEKKLSLDDFIDDIVFRCAVSETDKFTEDSLEWIIWALIVINNAEYVKRQRSYEDDDKKKLRLDILMKTPKGEYVVIELKLERAEKEALHNQLRRYMENVKKESHPAKLKGIIMARKASPDLVEELKKPENADISFVPYKFEFSSKWIEKELFQ